jgi:dTDP-L-rhamnose 4-epimerase
MKILITGGAGFIGVNLAFKLKARGHKVVILDNLHPQIHGPQPEETSSLYRSIKNKFEFHRRDVTIANDWFKVLDGVEVIVHLAAETGTGQSMYEIEKYTQVNSIGTALLLDILANTKQHHVKKIVIASSRAIYGEGKYFSEELGTVYPDQRKDSDMSRGDFEVKYPGASSPLQLLPTDEISKIHPSSVYGITKQNQEQLVMCVCPSLGIDCVAFRYQNVYGPGQSLKNPYTGILSIFSTLIKTNKPINIFEDGLESRDFVFIEDATDATILGIEKEEANGEIFNVGYGAPVNVLTVARTLVKKYGIDVPLNITGNYRIGDIRHNYADLQKIKSLLGYQPKYDFEAGISSFVAWVNEQEIAESRFEHSYNEMKSKGLLK